MLASKHDCYLILLEMKQNGEDVSKELIEIREDNKLPKKVIDELKKDEKGVANFYLNLNKKAHKIIKEVLTCEGKPVSNYIKIATSIITQAVIFMEHMYQEDINGQNNFIECLGLSRLSDGISEYFSTGNYNKLVSAVHQNKVDVKSLLDD